MDKQNRDRLQDLSAAPKKLTDQIGRISPTNKTCSLIFFGLAIWGGVNCINGSAALAATDSGDNETNQLNINYHIDQSSYIKAKAQPYRLNVPTVAALNLISLKHLGNQFSSNFRLTSNSDQTYLKTPVIASSQTHPVLHSSDFQSQTATNSSQTQQSSNQVLTQTAISPSLQLQGPHQSDSDSLGQKAIPESKLQSNTLTQTHQPQSQPLSNHLIYQVKVGDTVQTIAQKHQVSASELIDANKLQNPDLIKVDQSLNIPVDSDLEVKLVNTKPLKAIDRRDTELSKLKQSSSKGAAKSKVIGVTPITIENYNSNLNRATNTFVEPQLPPLLSPEQYLPDNPTEFNGFSWPAEGVMTSGYGMRWGRMHKGIDIAGPVGTPIFAAAPGEIVYAGWNSGGFGNLVKIKHSDGSITLYAHNSKIMVNKGQFVQQGEQIAAMGSTGRSTGPHLHFEIRPQGANPVNPIALLPKK